MMTDDEKRAEFHRLTTEADALREKAAPARAEYDAIRAKQCELEAELAVAKQKVLSLEAPIANIDWRRGALVRELKGKTGKPS